MQKLITNLKLHESTLINEYHVTRVPGGWIYRYTEWNVLNRESHHAGDSHNIPSMIFVPTSEMVKVELMEDLLTR